MKYYIIILSLCVLASCNKLLDEKPKSIVMEQFYNTAPEIETGVNAIYTPVRGASVFSALYPVQVEIYTEYLYGRGSHAVLNDYKGLDNTNITRVEDIWRIFYQAIRNANLIIQKAPLGKSISPADVTKYVSEARFLRALWYFHLVRNWGGVPIRTETNMDSLSVKRNSAEEVYNLILGDLQYAETNLPDNPRQVGTPSKLIAKAVLADVYMNLHNYTAARDKSLEVIDAKKYSLVNVTVANDFDKLFGADISNSTEEVFYIKFARTPSSQNFQYPIYTHYPNAGFYPPGGFYTFYSDSIQNSFVKAWDKSDLRYTYNWYSQTFGITPTTILNKKFSDKAATTGAGNDYPMYRYADVLLFYAETQARANGAPDADAMEKLNMVHRRAYGKNPTVADAATDFKLADYATLQPFIDLVVRERTYENCSEGKHWHDLKRLGTAKDVIKAVKNITVLDKHLLWPIPKIEYNYNKAIDPVKDQNPGY
ncbi:MAG: RagB/SusD family nutrient uptake outer membrane protein [Chitinophagaceae bacterium]